MEFPPASAIVIVYVLGVNCEARGMRGRRVAGKFKKRLESAFEMFAVRVCRHKYFVVAAVLLMTAAAASGLRDISIDTSNESFFYPGDPVLVRYDEFRDQFGRDDFILVAVRPDNLFSQKALARLREFHHALEEKVPHAAGVTSLANIRETKGDGDRLVVSDLLEKWPESAEDLSNLRQRVLTNPLYRNRLVSSDGMVTTLAIELERYSGQSRISVDDALSFFDDAEQDSGSRQKLSDEETHQALVAIESIAEAYKSEEFAIQVAGAPAVTDALKLAIQEDMRTFILLVVAIIVILLFAIFRSAAAVLLPLSVVLLALVSTVGLMGHLGTSIKLTIVILPSFLLAVGVGAAVHLLEIWKQRRASGEDSHSAIVSAVGHAGLPILLTSLTTAAGLGSFSFAEVAPVSDLGRYAALGVIIGLIYTLLLIPAGLAALPKNLRLPRQSGDLYESRINDALATIACWSVRNALPICVASILVAIASALLAAQLRFSHDVLSWLPRDLPVRQATQLVDRNMGGSVALEVVVDTKVENGLHDRGTLVTLDRLAGEIEALRIGSVAVGSTWSIAGLLKEIHQALNENRAEFYRIPENERLIPQEFLLFENSGSDDLEDLVDSRFRITRFSMRVPWRDTLAYPAIIEYVEDRFKDAFGGSAEVTVTGIMSLLSRTLEAAVYSTAQSYVIAFAVITLMMVLLIGRIGTGLISMVPNVAPVALTLALMQVFGIPLNLFTMLVGSIAIGLAVDDTVHFMHHFHRYLERTGNVEDAVRNTMLTSGRAMLATTIILSTGFFVFCFASMSNLVHFGLLTGITILSALAADFVLAPALMTLRYRKAKIRGGNQAEDQ